MTKELTLKKETKLTLNKETLKNLSDALLVQVVGGVSDWCNSGTCTCPPH